MTGAVHATAHALGAHYGIPHGMANAIMLPVVMEFNSEEVPDRYAMVADAMGVDVTGNDSFQEALQAVEAVKDLKRRIGITETLKQWGVPDDRERLMETVELAAGDSQIGYNPRYVEEEDLVDFYLKAL
jgi:alcohol dehydrogenase class IV